MFAGSSVLLQFLGAQIHISSNIHLGSPQLELSREPPCTNIRGNLWESNKPCRIPTYPFGSYVYPCSEKHWNSTAPTFYGTSSLFEFFCMILTCWLTCFSLRKISPCLRGCIFLIPHFMRSPCASPRVLKFATKWGAGAAFTGRCLWQRES